MACACACAWLQVMHLLNSLIERASECVAPHVALIASALPQVGRWGWVGGS